MSSETLLTLARANEVDSSQILKKSRAHFIASGLNVIIPAIMNADHYLLSYILSSSVLLGGKSLEPCLT